MIKLRKILLLIFALYTSYSSAQIPAYTLTARNLHLISPDSLIFDIYIRHTNYPVLFEYAGGQFYLDFNCNFGNGGTLTFRLLQSDFDSSCRPSNVTISPCILRAGTSVSPGPGFGCPISHTGLGTLIGKYSLRTTTSFLPLDSFQLRWRNPPVIGFVTKIFVYVGTVNTDITTPSTHFIELLAGINPVYTSNLPDGFKLHQNYPNPFNPKTKISYELRVSGYVVLKIFDISGKQIAILVNQKQNAGYYSAEWDAGRFGSGVYACRMEAGIYNDTKRMLLIK